MEGNGKRLGGVILSAIIIVAMLGWLASATITKIEITAVNNQDISPTTYHAFSHRKDNITFRCLRRSRYKLLRKIRDKSLYNFAVI